LSSDDATSIVILRTGAHLSRRPGAEESLFRFAFPSEGDEGKTPAAVAANQPLDHEKRKRPNPDPSKVRKDRPPGKPKPVPRR